MRIRGSSQTVPETNVSNQDNSKPKKAYYGITGLPSVTDAAFRAGGRFLEISFMKENPFIRLPFRFLSETVRYGASRMVQNIKEKTPAKDLWTIGLKKATEITFGSIFIEPNLFENRLERVGAGFLNTVVRIIGRGGLVLTKIINKENLNLKIMLDEFIARTSGRLIYLDTDSATIRLGLLTAEQLFINQWLATLPIKEYVFPWLMKQSINGSEPQTKKI